MLTGRASMNERLNTPREAFMMQNKQFVTFDRKTMILNKVVNEILRKQSEIAEPLLGNRLKSDRDITF